MGNQNLNETKNRLILDKYQFKHQLSDDKKIYKHKIKLKQYIAVQRTFATEQMILEYQKKVKQSLQIQHPYFLNQIEHAITTVSTICSVQHKVLHFFQYQSHNLQNQLKTRNQHGRYFQEKQFWSILCSCVLAMAHLTKNQMSYFCIHPKDIIIDSSGMVKLKSGLLSENNQQIINQEFYYSPQHLKALKNSNFHSLNNKSGVFTLGITLLNILFLQPLNQIYDYQNHSINFILLNKKLQNIESDQIREIIKKMLVNQSYDRISFTQLQQMLYNILESNSEENSRTNMHQSYLQYKQTQYAQFDKLKQSIYQIQKSQKNKQAQYQFNQRNFNQKVNRLKPMINDFQDNPSNYRFECQNQTERQKFDEEDVIQKNINSEKSYINQIGQKESRNNILQYDSISFSNTILNTRKAPLQQIYYVNNNLPTLSRNQSSLKSIEKKMNETFKSSKSKQLKNSSSIQSQHVRQQLSRGVYQGYKVNKMRHGYGVFTYAQGGKYCGQWNKNKMQGRGALYYANGQIAYQGQWKDDKLNGYGILYNQIPSFFSEEFDYKNLHLADGHWMKYQGNFIQDLKSGQGTLFLANGQYYRGYFHQDLPHGNGIYRCLNSKIIKGNWILGILQTN